MVDGVKQRQFLLQLNGFVTPNTFDGSFQGQRRVKAVLGDGTPARKRRLCRNHVLGDQSVLITRCKCPGFVALRFVGVREEG